jgi:ATP-dependent Clp protease ATP-binding subunit ClpA
MLEKLTKRSARVIILAQEEATALNHSCIQPGHVLLGLLREGVGVGSVALESLGVSYGAVRSKIIDKASGMRPTALGDLKFSPDTKRALERSVGEAHRLGHAYVGTESILLALVAEPEGAAAQILVELGVDLNRVRWQVTDLLGCGDSASSGSAHRDPPATQASAGFFEEFTDRAKRVVVMAQDEARGLNHAYIGSEHLLLGLVREGAGVGARALESLNVSLEAASRQVKDSVGRGPQAVSGHIPFSPSARKVLELAKVEASELGHGYIGTEHILLGLIREGESIGARVLVGLGADLERTRQQVVTLLAGHQPDPSSKPPSVPAEPDRRGGEAALLAEGMATADLADHEVSKLLEDALREAQDAGDREVSGEHVLLAMCADIGNGGWLVLRWAGAGPRQFVTAAIRASGNAAPHKESVPVSDDLRRALEDGYRTARRPVSAAALLASLLRNQEAGAARAVANAGLLPQDVLAAVVALARIGEIDAAAGEIAATGRPAGPRSWRQPPAITDAIQQETEDDAPVKGRDEWETPGWSGPDREATISMFQFRLAAVSAVYMLVLVLALIALVAAATHGRIWLLLLVPLLGVGNPRFGTWSLVPLAVLFWFLHLPVVAALVVAWIPLDAAMGAMMLQRRHIAESRPQNRHDCRVGAAGIVAAIGRGARSRK